jgi:hypothetical protein
MLVCSLAHKPSPSLCHTLTHTHTHTQVHYEATFDATKKKWKATRVAMPGNKPFEAQQSAPKGGQKKVSECVRVFVCV